MTMMANRAAALLPRHSRQIITTAISSRAATSSLLSSSSSVSSSSVEDNNDGRIRRNYSLTSAPRSSSAAATIETNESDPSSSPHAVYMWGTSKKGTIPVNLLTEVVANASATASSSPPSSAASSGGGLFSGDEKIMDHPMKLNVGSEDFREFLFGEKKKGEENDGVSLTRVDCGASGTAMITSDGRCFVMGSNKNGELGIGTDKKETSQPIHLPLPDPVAKASLGPNFSALLTTTGDLYTFGYGGSRINGMGCLGHGNMDPHPAPTIVTSLIEDGCLASDVHCGEYSTTVLTTEGEVLTCGAGSYGRLGNLETIDQLYLEPIELLGAEDVTSIACGHAFGLALNSSGIVHAWGRNNEGQLGTGMGLAADMYAMESLPRPIEGLLEGRTVVKIAAGHAHAAAVTNDGALFTWGMNYTHEPKLESSLLHAKIVDVACGKNYTLALDEEGRVYSMGKGKTGVLGLASTKVSNVPILVEGIPTEERVVSMSCGWDHVACATELK